MYIVFFEKPEVLTRGEAQERKKNAVPVEDNVTSIIELLFFISNHLISILFESMITKIYTNIESDSSSESDYIAPECQQDDLSSSESDYIAPGCQQDDLSSSESDYVAPNTGPPTDEINFDLVIIFFCYFFENSFIFYIMRKPIFLLLMNKNYWNSKHCPTPFTK